MAKQSSGDFLNIPELAEFNARLKATDSILEAINKTTASLNSQMVKFKGTVDDIDDELLAVAKAFEGIDTEVKGSSKTIEVYEKRLAELIETKGKLTANLEAQQKQIDKLESTVKKLTAEQGKQKKGVDALTAAKEKLANVDSDYNKELIKTRALVNQRNKEIRESVKVEQDLLTEYQKQSKRLNDLRNDYKNLVLAQNGSREGTEKLIAEIQKLDEELKTLDAEVGQFQRNVGNYSNSIKEAFEAGQAFTGGLGAIGQNLAAVSQALNIVGIGLGRIDKSIENVDKSLKEASASTRLLRKSLLQLSKVPIVALIAAIAGAVTAFAQARKGALLYQQAIETLTTAFKSFGTLYANIVKNTAKLITSVGVTAKNAAVLIGRSFKLAFEGIKKGASDAANAIVGPFNQAIQRLNLGKPIEVAKTNTQDYNKALENVNKSLDDIGESFFDIVDSAGELNATLARIVPVTKSIGNAAKIVRLQFDLEDQVRSTERALAGLNKEIEITQTLADDSTRSLSEQQEQAVKAGELIEERAAIRLSLAKEQLKVSEDVLRKELETQGIFGTTADEIRNIIKLDSLRFEVSNDALANQQTAILAIQEAETELAVSRLENIRRQNEISRDRFELEADFLVDITERQIRANLTGLQNERISLSQRRKIFEETSDLFESNLDKQLKSAQEYANNRLQVVGDIGNGEFEVINNVTKARLDADRLINASASELAEFSTGSGIDERTALRVLEFIRDAIDQRSDLAETRRALDEEEFARDVRLLQLKQQNAEAEKQFEIDATKFAQVSALTRRRFTESLFNKQEEQLRLQAENSRRIADITIADEEEKAAAILAINQQLDRDLAQNTSNKLRTEKLANAELVQAIANVAGQVQQEFSNFSNGIEERAKQRETKRLEEINENSQQRIAIAGDNAQAIQDIEQEAENQKKQVQREQAARERKFAIFQRGLDLAKVAFNTAVAVTRALAIGNIPGVVTASVIGAAQTAAILAAPLPALKDGTDNFAGGFALVSDSGSRDPREVVREPSGKTYLTGSKPEVRYLPKGTQVIPDYERQAFLESLELTSDGVKVVGKAKVSEQAQAMKYARMDEGVLVRGFGKAVGGIQLQQTYYDEQGMTRRSGKLSSARNKMRGKV